jgi:26S proteasome regulatory subunit T2
MGNTNNFGAGGKPNDEEDKDKKPAIKKPDFNSMKLGKRKKKKKGLDLASKLPNITPNGKCLLRMRKLERVKDYLLMEEDFVKSQKTEKSEDKQIEEDKNYLELLRGTPVQVGTLEEIINVMKVDKAPTETYSDIGGCEKQIREMKEAVELPLTHPELYEELGIKPPKGVILYGCPGTGKTLLAKAVANETSATFFRVVGSELIQKYSGEGPRLVRELFRLADEHSPSILFIDEIDAVGTKRVETSSGGKREVQRTMLELLNQLDGFEARSEVKVILATNRIETLDPALIRPGRIDRKIYFPYPDSDTKRKIFQIHTQKMSIGPDVNLETFIMSKDELTGADIKVIL